LINFNGIHYVLKRQPFENAEQVVGQKRSRMALSVWHVLDCGEKAAVAFIQ